MLFRLFFLKILFLTVVFPSIAQPILDSTSIPQVGRLESRVYHDSLVLFNTFPLAGNGINWNLTGVTSVTWAYENLSYQVPDPNNTLSGASMAVNVSGPFDRDEFWSTGSDSISYLGAGTTFASCQGVHFNLPLTMGDTVKRTCSNKLIRYVGSGSVTFPSWVYTDLVLFEELDTINNTAIYVWYQKDNLMHYVVQLRGINLSAWSVWVSTTNVGVASQTAPQLTMWPNPATEYLVLESPEPLSTVSVLTITGKLVEELSVDGTLVRISIDDYPPGLYTIIAFTRSGRLSSRFVKLGG